MLHKVTYCGGHISANTSPHQLCSEVTGRWGLLSHAREVVGSWTLAPHFTHTHTHSPPHTLLITSWMFCCAALYKNSVMKKIKIHMYTCCIVAAQMTCIETLKNVHNSQLRGQESFTSYCPNGSILGWGVRRMGGYNVNSLIIDAFANWVLLLT